MFKCYMADTGLLVSQLFADNEQTPHEVYRDILLGKLEINEGMFTENAVAQQLLASGHALYFFSKRDRENSRNTMEIDFLITAGYDDSAGRMRVSPVEVKSTKRYGAKSIDKFKDKFGKRVGGSQHLASKADAGRRRPRAFAAVHGTSALANWVSPRFGSQRAAPPGRGRKRAANALVSPAL